ncbi:glycosyltransferase family 4 protein [Paraburkholderia sp.]|uniref:glycosyltransferase family 4 protein n=1 Tax=Paraburkholderia sp. TaxID=1926495 RepID=UPI00239310D5|nr:glycosyltransferase family 4 protein [Paraburkholderia sp.]MDE1184670.1 glycosyltransferase family 4 protein [Paraburkholderia sp.]
MNASDLRRPLANSVASSLASASGHPLSAPLAHALAQDGGIAHDPLSAMHTLSGADTLDHTNHPLDTRASSTASHDASTSPSVLFVDQSGQLGGAEFALLPLAASCAARGKVVLLSEGPFRARLEALGVRVEMVTNQKVSGIKRQAPGLGMLRAVPAMLGQVRRIAAHARQFDVLFLNTQKALVLGALGKPLHRRPVVWYLHDILTREHFGNMQLRVVRWLTRHVVDHVVANSKASADAFSALTGIDVSKVPIVHNGIDADAFSNAPREPAEIAALRRRLELPENAYLVGLFGRLAPWKGQHLALEMLARVPDAHLVLVGAALFGEHAYEQALRLQAERLGIADRVHFAGFRDDMPAWMRAMDAILHTSTEPEPFGRVIVEGMAAGRPVIGSAAGGVKEILRHGENGWLVAPGDIDGYAHAIGMLRVDPALAQRVADQGAIEARRDFSLNNYLLRMTQAIANAAK